MFNTFYRICFNKIGSQGPASGLRLPTDRPVAANSSRLVLRSLFGLSALVAVCYVLTGCGAQVTLGKGVNASQGVFTASPASVDFGSVSVGNSANNTVSLVNSSADPVVVSDLAVSGNSSFSLVGQSQLPMTLAAGTTTTLKVHYNPKAASDDAGSLIISSNSVSVPKTTVKLHGKGANAASTVTPVLSSLTCANASITGAGTDSCTATLSTSAPSGGFSVGLASNNAAVTLPSSVTVPSNSARIAFTATAAAVTTSQTVVLSASAGGATQTFSLQLDPSASTTSSPSTLSLNATSISFGSVMVNTPSTQSVTLTAGGSAVTVSAGTVAGAGFSLAGATFPMTVNPGTPATLNVQFNPTSAGAVSGKLTLTNNSTNNSSAAISLSGTGTTHQIALSWTAADGSTDPISGYKVYRAASGSSSYQLMNPSIATQTAFTDSSAQSGTTYQYYVTSVDNSGAESTPSNTATVAVP